MHVYLSTAGSMAGARAVSYMGDMDPADLMALKSGGLDVHSNDDFKEHYDGCRVLMSEIEIAVEGLTFAPGETPSAPAKPRDLRRKCTERVNTDGTLKPYPLSTTANFIAEDLVPPDYRVRTS